MVRQQRSGNLKGRVNFCMPWTSSSLSINRLRIPLQFLLKQSWFRQNPTAEVGTIPLVTKHNAWVLPPACLKELCKERMQLCPLVIAGEGEPQPREEPCMAEPGLRSQFWGGQRDNSLNTPRGSRIWATCPGTDSGLTSTTLPRGPKVCWSHLGCFVSLAAQPSNWGHTHPIHGCNAQRGQC